MQLSVINVMRDENVDGSVETQGSNPLKQKLESIRQIVPDNKSTDQTADIPKQIEQEHLDNLHFFESMDRINRAIQGKDE